VSKYAGRTSWKFKMLRRQVLAESDVCWLCARPGADTVDHVLPLSLYPELAEDITNLRPAHMTCNSSRGQGTRPNQQPPRNRSRRW